MITNLKFLEDWLRLTQTSLIKKSKKGVSLIYNHLENKINLEIETNGFIQFQNLEFDADIKIIIQNNFSNKNNLDFKLMGFGTSEGSLTFQAPSSRLNNLLGINLIKYAIDYLDGDLKSNELEMREYNLILNKFYDLATKYDWRGNKMIGGKINHYVDKANLLNKQFELHIYNDGGCLGGFEDKHFWFINSSESRISLVYRFIKLGFADSEIINYLKYPLINYVANVYRTDLKSV